MVVGVFCFAYLDGSNQLNMFRFAMLLILLSMLATHGVGQVTISYCPSLDSKDPANIRAGESFDPNIIPTCGYCPESSCQVPIYDPVGGFSLGYYLFKDKELDRWAFSYSVFPQDEQELRAVLENRVEASKHKLQDKKSGIHTISVPLNPHLERIGDELKEILDASKNRFEAVNSQTKPWRDLAKVFQGLQFEKDLLVLKLEYTIPDRSSEIFNVIKILVDENLPHYYPTSIGDTLVRFLVNKEFPSVDIQLDRNERAVLLKVKGPSQSNAPQFIFYKDQLRHSLSGPDTLFSSKPKNGKAYYQLFLEDESGVQRLSLGKDSIALQRGDTSYAQIEATAELNQQVVNLIAEDIHGTQISKDIRLMQFENLKPQILLQDAATKSFLAPNEILELDTYNHQFQLHGKVTDDSPIRSFSINGIPVKLDRDQSFTHILAPTDNRKKVRIEAVDVIGNKGFAEFKLVFKESGKDREMNLIESADFRSRDPEYLKRDGQLGLKLEIKNEKFYLKKNPVIDSSQSAGAAEETLPQQPQIADLGAVVPFGLRDLDFNTDFQFKIVYSKLQDESKFFLTFGMNENWENYFFIFGEGNYLYLGQCENNALLGQPAQAEYRSYYREKAPFNYLEKVQVPSGFFTRILGTEYNVVIKRYKDFYLGSADDPGDWLFVTIDNKKDPPVELRYQLIGSNGRITGRNAGIAIWNNSHIAISGISFEKGVEDKMPRFIGPNEIEKYCFPTCFKVDPSKKEKFFDCLTTDYKALIVANGAFGGRASSLDSAISRGHQLKSLLTEEYQFVEDNVKMMENATKQEFLDYIDKTLPRECGSDTRLLIWIISHGTPSRTVEFKDYSVRSDEIWNILKDKNPQGNDEYECKQILMVLDACYSGDMTTDKQAENKEDRTICDANENKSRILVTSASGDPTKESLLTKQCIKQLSTYPDLYLTIDKLFALAGKDFSIEMGGRTIPTFTTFDRTNHASGSFLFIRKDYFH